MRPDTGKCGSNRHTLLGIPVGLSTGTVDGELAEAPLLTVGQKTEAASTFLRADTWADGGAILEWDTGGHENRVCPTQHGGLAAPGRWVKTDTGDSIFTRQ